MIAPKSGTKTILPLSSWAYFPWTPKMTFQQLWYWHTQKEQLEKDFQDAMDERVMAYAKKYLDEAYAKEWTKKRRK
jgi:hypothetical protein